MTGAGGAPVSAATVPSARCHPVASAICWLLGVAETYVGVWAAAVPRSFHDSFPGGGLHWLPPLGPYNEHLIRDFGALSLALAGVTVCAAIWPSVRSVATMALAWELYSIPHWAFHIGHLGPFDLGNNILVMTSLTGAVALPLLALILVWASRGRRTLVVESRQRPTPDPRLTHR